MKLNLENKKINIIFTSIILAIALAITAITGVQFRQFSKFETEFYTQDVDEVLYFSQFSPYLKGTVGDSEIYVKYGNQNTVLVAKPDKVSAYQTEESLSSANIVGIDGSTQLAAAQAKGWTVETKPSSHQAILALDSGADVAVLSYYSITACCYIIQYMFTINPWFAVFSCLPQTLYYFRLGCSKFVFTTTPNKTRKIIRQ